jgi:hypothetical protein
MKLSKNFISHYLFEEELPIFSATLMLLKPENYDLYTADKEITTELPDKPKKKFNIKRYKISNGEDEISIVTFLHTDRTIVSPLYNYIDYGDMESGYSGKVICYNYIGNIKPWENKIDKSEWNYPDIMAYRKVMDEIKTKKGLDLLHNAPEDMIIKELEVRKFKKEHHF